MLLRQTQARPSAVSKGMPKESLISLPPSWHWQPYLPLPAKRTALLLLHRYVEMPTADVTQGEKNPSKGMANWVTGNGIGMGEWGGGVWGGDDEKQERLIGGARPRT